MKNLKYILRLTVTLLLISAVVAGLLGFVDYLTADKIAAKKEESAQKAMQQVLPAEHYELLETNKAGVLAAYRADELGYVVRVESSGFGGTIDMMVGVYSDGSVSGVSIVSQSETASLGANCTRADWRAQFVGLSGSVAVDKDGGQIDSLTGATVTSRAVTKGVNLALELVEEVRK